MKPLLIVIGLTFVTFTSPAYPHERDSISDGLTDELLRPASEVSDMDNAPGVFKNQMDLGTRISVPVPDYGKISDMNIPFQPGLRVNPNAARLSSMDLFQALQCWIHGEAAAFLPQGHGRICRD